MTRIANTQKPVVVLIGMETIQALQAARIFARHEIPVVGLTANPKHFCCRTRTCERIIPVDVCGEAFVDQLAEVAEPFDQPPVLLPCHDQAVLAIIRHREALENRYRFLLPETGTAMRLMDKSLFYDHATRLAINVPNTVVVHSRADLDGLSTRLTFPCIVKPPLRSSRWSETMTQKAIKVESPDELSSLYRRVHACIDRLVVQEWVAGDDSELYSCNCYFDAAGRPQVTFVARKIRQWPLMTGESSLGQECRNDHVLEQTIRLFRASGFKGLGYLEMKYCRSSNRYFALEANIGRPTGRSAIAEAGGVALLFTMYCDLTGQPLPEERQQLYTGIKWIHVTRDLAASLHHWQKGRLTIRQWLKSLRGPKVYAVCSWRDPAPFWGDLNRSLRILVSSGDGGNRPRGKIGMGALQDKMTRQKRTGLLASVRNALMKI